MPVLLLNGRTPMPTKIELPYAVNEKVYLIYFSEILHVRIDAIDIRYSNYGNYNRVATPAVSYSFHLTCFNGSKKWRHFGKEYLAKSEAEALAKLNSGT